MGRGALMNDVVDEVTIQVNTFGPIVARALDGDQAAWQEIVERLGGVVWAQVRRHGLSEDLGEEVVARTWSKLVNRLHTVEDPERLPGWLATTARREVYDALRRKQRMVVCEDLGDNAEVSPVRIDERLLDQELIGAALEAFGRLNRRDQEMAGLRFLASDPLSYAEIADRMGLPIGSIGPTIGRIVAKLRRDPAIAALLEDEHEGVERQLVAA